MGRRFNAFFPVLKAGASNSYCVPYDPKCGYTKEAPKVNMYARSARCVLLLCSSVLPLPRNLVPLPRPQDAANLHSGGGIDRKLSVGACGCLRPAGTDGPDLDDFPGGMAAAPVTWEYRGTDIRLTFRTAFAGAAQRPDGTVASELGWCICKAPPAKMKSR